MFSSVVFHDARARARHQADPRLRGLRRAGRAASTRAGTPGETQPPGAAGRDRRGLQEPDQAGVGRLHRRASTTGRASTRSCWRSMPKGLIGLSSCLKGEVASALRVGAGAARRSRPPRRLRDILGTDNFFLEMQYQGIEEQRIVNNGLLPLARDLNLPLVVHQRRALPAAGRSQAARHPAVHRHRQVGERREAAALHGDQFFLKTADADGGGVRRLSRRR